MQFAKPNTLVSEKTRTNVLLQCSMEFLLLTAAAEMVIVKTKRQRESEIAAARERQKKKRRVWVRQWLLRRAQFGQYDQLMVELGTEDRQGYKNFLRIEQDNFNEILQRITPRIKKQDTFMRKALEPGLKLALTLRYLATGNSYKSLQYSFRVAHNSICKLIPEVCQAIIDEYSAEVMSCPTTPAAWMDVAEEFNKRWNFPHCVGAIDGKHISIRKPIQSGSYYYNYKGFFSIVLLAVVDADYKFLYVDIGANGAGSDAGIFNDTDLQRALESGGIGLPAPDPLPNDDEPIGYFLVGDDAFALKTWLMKPLPLRNMTVQQRIYNYRLSRARRVVENVFGILASRFRCLLTTMPQKPVTVSTIALTCCVLHNLIRLRDPNADMPFDLEHPDTHEIIPGTWRENANLPDMREVYRGNANRAAKLQRQYLIDYVNSKAGNVPWQESMI